MFVQMDSWVDLSIEEVAKTLSFSYKNIYEVAKNFHTFCLKQHFQGGQDGGGEYEDAAHPHEGKGQGGRHQLGVNCHAFQYFVFPGIANKH